jgi:hypothetical protein
VKYNDDYDDNDDGDDDGDDDDDDILLNVYFLKILNKL